MLLVPFGVGSLIFKNHQILWVIISLVPVYVVYHLFGFQRPSEHQLCYYAMRMPPQKLCICFAVARV